MPQDCAELEGWISDRNCDLRNALEFGNTGTITQLGTLLSQGIAQLSHVSIIVDGVDDRRVRCQAQVGARWRSSPCTPFDVREPSVRVRPVWVVPLHSMGASQAV